MNVLLVRIIVIKMLPVPIQMVVSHVNVILDSADQEWNAKVYMNMVKIWFVSVFIPLPKSMKSAIIVLLF